jgi:hypothetical protein
MIESATLCIPCLAVRAVGNSALFHFSWDLAKCPCLARRHVHIGQHPVVSPGADEASRYQRNLTVDKVSLKG